MPSSGGYPWLSPCWIILGNKLANLLSIDIRIRIIAILMNAEYKLFVWLCKVYFEHCFCFYVLVIDEFLKTTAKGCDIHLLVVSWKRRWVIFLKDQDISCCGAIIVGPSPWRVKSNTPTTQFRIGGAKETIMERIFVSKWWGPLVKLIENVDIWFSQFNICAAQQIGLFEIFLENISLQGC